MMGSPRADAARLTIDDVDAAVREVPGIVEWDPQVMLPSTTIRHAGATTTARILGSSERWQRVWERGLSSGESFDAADVASSARVAVVGRTVARELFGEGDPIGADIQVGAVPVRVIGVLEVFGTDLHGMDRDDEIVMPISTVMRRLNNMDAISGAKLLIAEPDRGREIASEVSAVLRRRHGIGRDQPDDFHILTALRAQEIVANSGRVLTLYLPLGAGIIVIVGGIIAAALMLGSVSERVSEIGLRRAVGASADDIHRQFLMETATTTVVGGIGGVVLGFVAVKLAASELQVSGSLSWLAVAIGLSAAVVTGWAAGVIPARRAARLNPVDALR
jgi:putative ABC transport system permease protein